MAAPAPGTIYTWGRGNMGQLGTGKKEDSAAPQPVAGSQKLVTIGCAHFHSVGITQEGEVYSWGRGALGLLGHGNEADYDMPRRVEGLAKEKVIAIACGPYHSSAVTQDKVLAWGWCLATDQAGRVDESFNVSPTPVPLPAMKTRVVGVSCGCYATAVWTENGQLLTWGNGSSGQLGHGGLESEVAPRPVAALQGTQVVQVAMGGMPAEKHCSDQRSSLRTERSQLPKHLGARHMCWCTSQRTGALHAEDTLHSCLTPTKLPPRLVRRQQSSLYRPTGMKPGSIATSARCPSSPCLTPHVT